jgi:hypothetical protein
MSDNCTLQYLYPTKELKEKYKINCADKKFLDYNNLEKFNNDNFLNFIDEKYGNPAFKGDSPFTFKDNYINLTNDNLCDPKEYSLKPQQKFVGQVINPATNIKSSLIYHGLGSGKTCTSLVVGEAFKSISKEHQTHLLYVVPAPLIQQYKDEIIGELKEIDGKKQIWSCTSQCVITNDDNIGDIYVNTKDNEILKMLTTNVLNEKQKLNLLTWEIEKFKLEKVDAKDVKKEWVLQQQKLIRAENLLKNKKEIVISKISKVFEIVSHNKFINDLFKELKDGKWQIQKYLLEKNSPLLKKNSILVIDEIQRLISAEGKLYKKLFSAINYYTHPELRILLLSATPIYDNPYELALTMNLLKPKIPFPLSKDKFYSFFIGNYDEKTDKCIEIKGKNYITENSCLINKDLLKYLCSGYISYFRGGNPNAYPYKRIITLEHIMPPYQKNKYILSLESDIKKEKTIKSEDETIKLFSKEGEKEDKLSGIYTNTQQICNIALPIKDTDIIDSFDSIKSKKTVTQGLINLKNELKLPSKEIKSVEKIINILRQKSYSEKFCSIISLSNNCNGPVFIFSNWLQFGVEALSIILDACGYKKFPAEGQQRYFIWSSETSSDLDLISKAKSTFNSFANKDGSLLKIILGTRSIMEGVSFKNVKQVHITDPWWNESRIEQIIARAIRFCSHSLLSHEEQWTDIYRHYSILPRVDGGDLDVIEMLKKNKKSPNFKYFNYYSIEQKMVNSALKKSQINNEFENILKETAYDCNINNKGNIVRLEEMIRPLSNGKYQIYFKNPNNLINYLREGIPSQISFEDILNRKYSFPNASKFKNIFTECGINENNILIPYDTDADILNLSDNLNLYEEINCWKSKETFNQIITKCNSEIQLYFNNIIKNFELISLFRKKILGEIKISDINIKYKTDPDNLIKNRNKLFICLQKIKDNPETDQSLKNKINKLLLSQQSSQILNKKIIDIIFTYNLLPVEMIDELINLDSETINKLYNEAKSL